MEIIDLMPEYEKTYFCCLEEWSDDMKDAGDHKACWYGKMKEQGLRVKMARNEEGNIVGMIQYVPVEKSFAEGNDLHVVLCIWVHGHKQGVGNFQKKGIGSELLQAAEEDSRQMGKKGLVVWGLVLPFFMRASWFKKHGYKVVDKDGMQRLLWKPFTPDAVPPVFIKQKKKPEKIDGKVAVTLFINGWCPAMNIAFERTKRAVEEFKDHIQLTEYGTLDKDMQREWGLTDAVIIDGRKIRMGPPLSYEKIRRKVEKRVKKLS
ncbi:MAG: GNAT family N-acetyltransferase [Bacteroidetes bacterium]|nr:GNAT family N-acetyltransferase [Bacteroidota bacterium]